MKELGLESIEYFHASSSAEFHPFLMIVITKLISGLKTSFVIAVTRQGVQGTQLKGNIHVYACMISTSNTAEYHPLFGSLVILLCLHLFPSGNSNNKSILQEGFAFLHRQQFV